MKRQLKRRMLSWKLRSATLVISWRSAGCTVTVTGRKALSYYCKCLQIYLLVKMNMLSAVYFKHNKNLMTIHTILTIITALKYELICLPIFLMVKWGQSSPWRSHNSTCAVAVVIYSWECVEIKLQLSQRPLDVLGMLMVRPLQQPCCGHLDSHGCLRRDLSIAIDALFHRWHGW